MFFASKIPEERLLRNGHAVDVVEAENRPFSRSKGTRLSAAEQRENELLETEAFNELNMSKDEHADDQSSGNVTYRVSDGRTGRVPVVSNTELQGLPRWDARWPIDVWVSCGEPFVPLEGMFQLEQTVVSLHVLSTKKTFTFTFSQLEKFHTDDIFLQRCVQRV